ncbi:hypothetical protein DLM78_04545 [Leptospira stimsonii]|uniref:Uncharacterized protein n=1 Tax=Leptospira stimsonii TaxID=2202203 RepID=A0A8B3CU62_9LEPT|nr:hypothetical protein DLM78_04545 [Leptospira stimsonii]
MGFSHSSEFFSKSGSNANFKKSFRVSILQKLISLREIFSEFFDFKNRLIPSQLGSTSGKRLWDLVTKPLFPLPNRVWAVLFDSLLRSQSTLGKDFFLFLNVFIFLTCGNFLLGIYLNMFKFGEKNERNHPIALHIPFRNPFFLICGFSKRFF